VVKVFAFIPKRSDIDDKFFHEHWAGPHAEHAQRITTIRRYVQSHRIGIEVPILPPAIYDGVAEVWFDDTATAAGMGEDPNYVNYAHADEPNFIDTAKLSFMIGEEHWLRAPDAEAGESGVKTMLLLRRRAGSDPAELATHVASLGDFDGAATQSCITVAVPETYTPDAEPPFDAVLEVSYRNEGELATAGEDLRALVGEQLGGVIDPTGSVALVARELRVVWPEPFEISV
jgi:uncharacterized protein (TIGR02118 family)